MLFLSSCSIPKVEANEPFLWQTPDNHLDSENEWNFEYASYDDNVTTKAWNPFGFLGQYTAFLYLNYSIPIFGNACRYYASGLGDIDVDVKLDGEWVDVYEGTLMGEENQWVEKNFAEGVCDVIRIRFYMETDMTVNLNECDVYGVPQYYNWFGVVLILGVLCFLIFIMMLAKA